MNQLFEILVLLVGSPLRILAFFLLLFYLLNIRLNASEEVLELQLCRTSIPIPTTRAVAT